MDAVDRQDIDRSFRGLQTQTKLFAKARQEPRAIDLGHKASLRRVGLEFHAEVEAATEPRAIQHGAVKVTGKRVRELPITLDKLLL